MPGDENDGGMEDWEMEIEQRAFEREQASRAAKRAVEVAKDHRDGGRKRR
jgi:hypothetical protein